MTGQRRSRIFRYEPYLRLFDEAQPQPHPGGRGDRVSGGWVTGLFETVLVSQNASGIVARAAARVRRRVGLGIAVEFGRRAAGDAFSTLPVRDGRQDGGRMGPVLRPPRRPPGRPADPRSRLAGGQVHERYAELFGVSPEGARSAYHAHPMT